MKSSLWRITLLAFTLSAEASGLPLSEDFKVQLKRGITFYFFASPDEGTFITLRGSSAVFRYLDGTKADGSLQKQVDTGSFNFKNDQVKIHAKFLKKDIALKLKPYPPELATGIAGKSRFLLIGPDLPFGGYGPVEVPLKRRIVPFEVKR